MTLLEVIFFFSFYTSPPAPPSCLWLSKWNKWDCLVTPLKNRVFVTITYPHLPLAMCCFTKCRLNRQRLK